MTTSNKQKAAPRKFWLSPYMKNDENKYMYVDDETAPDKIHVIEYSAYDMAVAALKNISNEWVNGCGATENLADRLKRYAEQTLASLGESEVGEG